MPRVGCSSQIIASNGYYATSAASWRYRLLGDQRRGDLSLTIRNVRMDDSGDYHCRAMSWYRDDKIFVTLKVLPGECVFLELETDCQICNCDETPRL